MEKKRMAAAAFAGLLGLMGLALFAAEHKRPRILEIGILGNSYWDVACADPYRIIDHAIEKFEKSHPDTRVHYYSGISKKDYSEWLSERILKGETPDVFMVLSQDFRGLVSLGVLENLDGRMGEDPGFSRKDFYDTALEAGLVNGSQYALPYETVPMLMFVNRSLLEKEGIRLPSSDWTWEEMYQICERVTYDGDGDGRKDQFGTYNYSWLEALYSNGGRVFDHEGKKCYLDGERTLEAVRFLDRLGSLYQRERVTQETFDQGNVAFMPMSFAQYRTYKTYPYRIKKYSNFQWECTTLPAGPQGGNISRVDSLLLGISSKSRQKDLAWEFLKLMTGDREIQMELFLYSQGASVLKSVTNSLEAEEILKKDTDEKDKIISHTLLNQVIENGCVIQEFSKYSEAMALSDGEVEKIFSTGSTMEESLKISKRMVEAVLQK
ncbi:MAG: sugar ABC transporter substrate-binding protein [Eubacteriales bacterium]|nr:sugar ABC transporter substrate-binding protein [Eubacteriales bacterium]